LSVFKEERNRYLITGITGLLRIFQTDLWEECVGQNACFLIVQLADEGQDLFIDSYQVFVFPKGLERTLRESGIKKVPLIMAF
jgi:hypothetical protein